MMSPPKHSELSVRLFRLPCLVFFAAAVLASAYLLLGRNTLCTLHRGAAVHPGLPTARSCAHDDVAVDANGVPCIPLRNLTARTYIHRAATHETTYMYCSIPKNGCSYHIDLLHRVNGDFFRGRTKHMPGNKGKIMIDDEGEAARLLANPAVPKYMVIRNPLTRVLSGYICKVERYVPDVEKTPASFQHWARDQFARFETWEGVNPHWRAQTEFCGFDMRDVQKRFHVFRVEQPAAYVDFIYKIIPSRILETGWDRGNSDFRSFVLGPRRRTGHTEEKFYEYMGSLETFDLLERTYRKDIDVLGYRDEVTQMRSELATILEKAKERSAVEVKL